MKTTLQARLLQHFAKKNRNQGFTLIELLVVIIIIGVLSAIALPNFLNQSAKAKQSEAKTAIGSINSAQTAYRQENSAFAGGENGMESLALGLPTKTASYTYAFGDGTSDLGTVEATRTDSALKGYAGAVARYNNDNNESVINSVICEASEAGADAGELTGGGDAAAACNEDDVTLGAPEKEKEKEE